MEIESVHYYSYVAPGIEEKVPWRAENIRRVIFKATVTDLNERTLTLDYTFKSLYDCRNDTGKPGFYYFDSRYQQDFTFDHEMVGKRFLRVTYDRESRKAHTLDKQETTFSYSKNYVPFGVRQAGLSAYPETTIQDSLPLDKLLAPAVQDILTGWQEDGIPRLAQNMRVIDASFSLPPNTEFTCSYVNFDLSDDSTVHKKIFIAYPTEHKVGERVTILLTPGDSITQDKELFATTHKRRYQGRGSEQNNFQYSYRRFADTWIRLVLWMLIGLDIYACYGIKHSKLEYNQANRHGQLALNMIGIVLAILCVITGLWHQQTVGWEESKVLLIISFVFAFTHLGFYMVRIWKQTTKVF